MNNRPIIFSADMVRALLSGNKTQTRRPINPQPECIFDEDRGIDGYFKWNGGRLFPTAYQAIDIQSCPFGQVGDLLWVRETWCCESNGGSIVDGSYLYRADGLQVTKDDGDGGTELRKDGTEASPWIPSIHMPRHASRLTLRITDIRVERVQDISEVASQCEGAKPRFEDEFGIVWSQPLYKHGFFHIWNSIYNAKNKPQFAWENNPWCWCISFEVIRKNVDEVMG